MRFKILRDFSLHSPEGIVTLKQEQSIEIDETEAIPLLQDNLIEPIGTAAYMIFSEILHAFLWVVETKQDMHPLRARGIAEAIYVADEIRGLKGIDKEGLKALHRVKEVFSKSTVENVCPKEGPN